jgi:hypothetical protein
MHITSVIRMTIHYDGSHTYDCHHNEGAVFVKFFIGTDLNFIGEIGGIVYN